MKLKGKLQEMNLPDLIQVISIGGKSGKLHLSRGEEKGYLIFNKGRILQASLEGSKKSIGRILVAKGILQEKQIHEALLIQRNLREWKPIGAICVEYEFITKEQLEEGIKTLITQVVSDLLAWNEGHFSFEAQDYKALDEINLDMREFIFRAGLSADELIKEGTKLLEDKTGRDVPPGEEISGLETKNMNEFVKNVLEDADISFMIPSDKTEGSKISRKGVDEEKWIIRIYKEIKKLKDILRRIDEGMLFQEFTFAVLRFASQIVGRVLLFHLDDRYAKCIGHMGISSRRRASAEKLKDLKIPIQESGIFKDIADQQRSHKGKLPKEKWNKLLPEKLDGAFETEVLIAPLILGGNIKFIIYADNYPSEGLVQSIVDLEYFLYQASMALEIVLLERQIEK